jgi:hypothetical protein
MQNPYKNRKIKLWNYSKSNIKSIVRFSKFLPHTVFFCEFYLEFPIPCFVVFDLSKFVYFCINSPLCPYLRVLS